VSKCNSLPSGVITTLARSILRIGIVNNYLTAERPLAMDAATKSELLEAAQYELMNHHWDTFCTEPLSIAEGGKGVIVPGCVNCRKLLYTNNQYLSHLALDVLPQILERFID
jgi:hypothetical protein